MKSLPISYSQLFHQELTCIFGEIYIRLIYLYIYVKQWVLQVRSKMSGLVKMSQNVSILFFMI